MPKVKVRDINVSYTMAGSAEPALLFVHGMCGGAWNWEDQLERLSPHFTCVAYDRRGHCDSESGNEDQSDRTHVDDAAALIDALELDRPIVVGASSGAIIAVELARRYPDRIRGAVLMEPPLLGLTPVAGHQLIEEIGPAIKNALDSAGPRAAVDALFEIVCPRFWAQTDEPERDRLRDNVPMLFATLEREPADPTPENLATIEVPILIMEGTASHPGHLAINQVLYENLPNARFVAFNDSGHVIFAEKPAEFAQAVLEFARELVPAEGVNAGYPQS